MNSRELRKSFLDFFAEKGHTIVPSAPLLPSAPNLLFTNAGMNQFVPYFLGEEEAPFPRAADTQKCIRAGGKHNDLEDVGFDTYHHTFFEMLGNWSFGDYFKKEAIAWAWELLTERWGFPAERLYATVYDPGEGEPADFDEEAAAHWKEIFRNAGLDPEERVLRSGKKDNFWMMGDTGPCGPCSEIHIDLTPNGDTKGRLVNADSPFCIEIWNLVFIQFNAAADGSLTPLANRHVDTGMGFERVAGILETTRNFTDFSHPPSNYDSDLFTEIFAKLSELCGQNYGQTVPSGTTGLSPEENRDVAFRVIADHIRTVSCAIADGIAPSNEGRNYVIRRILRRGILYGRKLNLEAGFMGQLFAAVQSSLGEVFPELKEQAEYVRRTIESEELTFGRTLDRGLAIFSKWADEGKLTGANAFVLYDTYGFPFDLTQLLARERGLALDENEFALEMEAQRQRARAARKTSVITVKETDDEDLPETRFCGYDLPEQNEFPTKALQIIQDDKTLLVLVEETPFYAEMGGQVGDTGTLFTEGASHRITDTIKTADGAIAHVIPATEDPTLTPGADLRLSLDRERRARIQRHHSATHLLHHALRGHLGNHVRQAGSLVAPDRLRFDFSHFEALTSEQLEAIEKGVNQRILRNDQVAWQEIPFSEKPDDVVAFFGEKYGAIVRVVDIGGYSKELCGGTHVRQTGEIGLFKIISESAISAGVRRIEATVGLDAWQTFHQQDRVLHEISRQLACSTADLGDRIHSLLSENKKLREAEKREKQKAAAHTAGNLAEKPIIAGKLSVVCAEAPVDNAQALRQMGSEILSRLGDYGLVLLGAKANGKAMLACFTGPGTRKEGWQAGQIIRETAPLVDGKGGGKPDFAMGGGTAPNKIPAALEAFAKKFNEL
ncbi:MAG: alanine--tRNA ligase [Opitutales bacterium]|nr:alanine--tRNA ligase [Opitutales bacterium]